MLLDNNIISMISYQQIIRIYLVCSSIERLNLNKLTRNFLATNNRLAYLLVIKIIEYSISLSVRTAKANQFFPNRFINKLIFGSRRYK